MKRIFFIGYMGAGKSFTARRLEEASGLQCVDLDDRIEQVAGRNIKTIFNKHGEAYFRRLETEVLEQVLLDPSIAIVACGGGLTCTAGVGQLIQDSGHVVHLDPPVEVILPRLLGNDDRPVLLDKGKSLTESEIRGHKRERHPCYSFAHQHLVESPSEEDIQRWVIFLKSN